MKRRLALVTHHVSLVTRRVWLLARRHEQLTWRLLAVLVTAGGLLVCCGRAAVREARELRQRSQPSN